MIRHYRNVELQELYRSRDLGVPSLDLIFQEKYHSGKESGGKA